MPDPQADATLVPISDTSLTVTPEQDVRSLTVVDRHGDEVGTVQDLFIDEQGERVRFLQVASGGFLGMGKDTRLIPVDAITQLDEAVHIDTTRSTVAGSPVYDPDLVAADQAGYYVGLYGYYGYEPYWGTGYVNPTAYPPVLPGPERTET